MLKLNPRRLRALIAGVVAVALAAGAARATQAGAARIGLGNRFVLAQEGCN